jgi:hypothetical protein
MTDKDFKEDRDSGMVPVKLLPERNKFCNETGNVDGILPPM